MADRDSGLTLSDLILNRRPVDPYANLLRAALGQGLGMGWGDEAEAWLRSKLVEGSPGYERELARIRDEYQRYVEQNPMLAPAAEFAGGVLPAIGSYVATIGSGGAGAPAAAATTARTAGALARAANAARTAMRNPYVAGAVTGTTQSAISGAGSAKEGERTGGALVGGGVGLGLGLGIPTVFRGGPAAYNWLRERLAPSDQYILDRAAGKVNEALNIAGMTPAEAEQAVAADRAMGLPSTLADVSRPTVDLAEAAAQRGGEGAETIADRLTTRPETTKSRTEARLRSDVSNKDFFNERKNLIDDLRKKAKPAYDAAFFTPEGKARTVDNETINEILKSPKVQQAYRRGKEYAQADADLARIDKQDPERYVLPDIYESVASGERDPLTNAPIMTDKLSGKLPTVQVLDYIKRGLDGMIDSAFSSSDSIDRTAANQLKEFRRRLVSALDENVPEYKQARTEYAGDMEVRDAMDAGFNDFNRMAPEEVLDFIRNATSAEREAFKSGAVRSLYTKIMNTARNTNAARDIINNEIIRRKLMPMFDSQAQFDLFKAALQRDAQLHENATRILHGSATARRQAGRASLEEEPGIGDAIITATTGGFGQALTNFAIRTARSAKMTEAKAAKIADLLMSSDPHEVAAAVQILEDQAEKSATKEALTTAAEIGSVGGAASMAPITPTPAKLEEETELSTEPAEPLDVSDLSIEEAIAKEDELMNQDKKRTPGPAMVR